MGDPATETLQILAVPKKLPKHLSVPLVIPPLGLAATKSLQISADRATTFLVQFLKRPLVVLGGDSWIWEGTLGFEIVGFEQKLEQAGGREATRKAKPQFVQPSD